MFISLFLASWEVQGVLLPCVKMFMSETQITLFFTKSYTNKSVVFSHYLKTSVL